MRPRSILPTEEEDSTEANDDTVEMLSKRDRKRSASKPKEDVEAKPTARAKIETKARTRSICKHDEDTSEANIVHIDELVGDRQSSSSTSSDNKSKIPKTRKHKTLKDVETAIRAREGPYGMGHRQAVTVGSGNASKSKNILPHFDIDPRYAIVVRVFKLISNILL